MVHWAQMSTNQGLLNTSTDGTWLKAEAVEVIERGNDSASLCG
jgi:hypothetical protein